MNRKKLSKFMLWRLVGLQRSYSFSILALLPSFFAIIFLLYLGKYDALEVLTMLVVVLLPTAFFLLAHWYSSYRPWQAVANILMSFRENDYSLRSSVTKSSDIVNTVQRELNGVADFLAISRSSVYETQKLMARILAEVDLAVFLFDNNKKLVMANRYGAELFAKSAHELEGMAIDELDLTFAQLAAHTSVHEHSFPLRKSRWLVKHSAYRQQGLPYQFFMLADIGRDLREEELEAWRKLTRILSHEINNALTPLKTTVGSMSRTLNRGQLYDGWQDDFTEGLRIIDARIDNLNRLVNSYSQLARLPAPQKQETLVSSLLERIVADYPQCSLSLKLGPELKIDIDSAQIEQVLINLIKNAHEASTQQQEVELSWYAQAAELTIMVKDQGCGIENPDNLFIPYFTTKPQGSGIGLVLSRQIIEAHKGRLDLVNNKAGPGCTACITLPL
ncbi:PAS domain-containing sensor histidine kinase [Agaribacterium sp. ZY112]|uniref:sensor histidine kinase n=1 Tax=Agaribacterium sp. ZY112 TaxID=3233574 RepID=UPI0035265575